MRHFASIDALAAAAGTELGRSAWVTIDQETIDRFAAATGDVQWIHVDRERAAKTPFGGTIAHGYYTLSLAPMFSYRMLDEIYRVDGVRLRINYGCNRVRFTEPVKSGSRLRLALKLLSIESTQHGAKIITEARFEIEGTQRPACVAELVAVLVPETG